MAKVTGPLMSVSPSGYAWNGYLVGQTIGANGSTIAAAKAAYNDYAEACRAWGREQKQFFGL